jgi:hypothetical protein
LKVSKAKAAFYQPGEISEDQPAIIHLSGFELTIAACKLAAL